MRFHVETMDQRGLVQVLDLEAKDKDEVCGIARQRGLFVTSVKVVSNDCDLSMKKEHFWQQCSEKGISICKETQPNSFSYTVVVSKHPTISDSTHWRSSHVFYTMEEACLMAELYLTKGVEPQLETKNKSFWTWLWS